MHDTDRRVIYTKKLLRDSLMDLMEEKPIGRISVTELCKGAGINRGTFYSHYRQPEDVLANIEDELFNDIKNILNTQTDADNINLAVVYALYRNRDACRMLINKNGDPSCMDRILDISKDYFIKNILPKLNSDNPETNYLHTFIFSGDIAVLKEWLAEGAVISPEEIAAVLTNMHNKLLKDM